MFKLQPWMSWAFLEAGTKTANKVLHKVVGRIAATFGFVLLASLVVGLVRTLLGFILAKLNHQKILTHRSDILGACLFGITATLNTVLPFSVFILNGDIGIHVFILSLSIIPGALIDKIFFKHRLTSRQWLGIAIAILAGYSILNWPSFKEFLALPLWIWLSFISTFLLAFGQGIKKRTKKINPFVLNFWGGLVNIILILATLLALNQLNIILNFSLTAQKLWLISGIVALISFFMWGFGITSYKRGAPIAFKNLISLGGFLVMAMILGIIIFQEPATWSKLIGVVLYFIAFGLMNIKKPEPTKTLIFKI